METFTEIIEAQTSLLRELRETYVAIADRRDEKKYVLRGDGSLNESAAATAMAAILRSIENLALTTLPAAPNVTQQIEPPAAEFCKVTHDVVRIRNERNGRQGWENHAAEIIGISPKRVIEIWDAAVEGLSDPVKPKLAIGQTWRTRSGDVGVIERKSVGRFFCRFGRRTVRSYDAEGNYDGIISGFDLAELVSDPAPAEANTKLDDTIAEAYAKPYFAESKTVKPKLAIGQTWRTRSGEVGVIEKTGGRFFCRFGPDFVRRYDAEGNYELDLMELVSDEDTEACYGGDPLDLEYPIAAKGSHPG